MWLNKQLNGQNPRLNEQLEMAEGPVKSCGDIRPSQRGLTLAGEPSVARILAGSGGRKWAQSRSEPFTRGAHSTSANSHT